MCAQQSSPYTCTNTPAHTKSFVTHTHIIATFSSFRSPSLSNVSVTVALCRLSIQIAVASRPKSTACLNCVDFESINFNQKRTTVSRVTQSFVWHEIDFFLEKILTKSEKFSTKTKLLKCMEWFWNKYITFSIILKMDSWFNKSTSEFSFDFACILKWNVGIWCLVWMLNKLWISQYYVTESGKFSIGYIVCSHQFS